MCAYIILNMFLRNIFKKYFEPFPAPSDNKRKIYVVIIRISISFISQKVLIAH